MPLLYNKRRNAFRQLQLEILKILNNKSIFVWREIKYRTKFYGILAARPEYFANSNIIIRRPFTDERFPYFIIYKNLKLHVLTHVIQRTTRIIFPLNYIYNEKSLSLTIISYKIKEKS
jgi:hypothetical protein